jgi:hypothetical protein
MRVPRISGFDKLSRPPVEEMISRLPVTQSPVGKRSTAGVYSVTRTRGARAARDAGGCVIRLKGSIIRALHCVGDYERVCKGEVTPTQVDSLEKRKRSPVNSLLRMSIRLSNIPNCMVFIDVPSDRSADVFVGFPAPERSGFLFELRESSLCAIIHCFCFQLP